MATFCETLKGLNPELQFTYGSGERYMRYLNYWNENAREFTSDESDWRKDYHEFCREHIHPERLMRLLFSNQNLCATACQSGAVDDGIILDCIRYSEYGIRLVLL